jgi:hypothetical protein
VTDTTRDPAVDSNDSDVDESDAVHGAAACVMVRSRPPIAMVPVRVVPAGLAATRYVTVPLPEPEAPVSTVIQEAPETAVHPHPDATVTSTLPSAPAAAMFWVVGLNTASHAAPACVMTKDWPAIVSVVDRELLVVFAATLYPMVPLPVPVVGVLNVIHAAVFWVLQKQPSPEVTAIVPVPAAAFTDALVGEML